MPRATCARCRRLWWSRSLFMNFDGPRGWRRGAAGQS